MLDEILETLKSNNSSYRCVRLSGCGYKIDFDVTCTGADILSSVNVPFMHEILKLEIKHVDNSNVDSFDLMHYLLEKSTPNNHKMVIYGFNDCVQSDIYDEFTGFVHERCQYSLTTVSTISDKLYISFYLLYTGVQ